MHKKQREALARFVEDAEKNGCNDNLERQLLSAVRHITELEAEVAELGEAALHAHTSAEHWEDLAVKLQAVADAARIAISRIGRDDMPRWVIDGLDDYDKAIKGMSDEVE